MTMPKALTRDQHPFSLTNCARCGMNHGQIWFQRLDRPHNTWTHWAMCPKTFQPILMKFDCKDSSL